jgi:hypothetical protein
MLAHTTAAPSAPRAAPPLSARAPVGAPIVVVRPHALGRHLLATVLVLHGLAHAAPGMWAADVAPAWLVTPVWLVAMVGLMGAGFGLWGTTILDHWWRHFAVAGALASLALLIVAGSRPAMIGLVLDPLIVVTALEWMRTATFAPTLDEDRRRRTWPRAIAGVLVAALLAWTAGVIALRPWMTTWGTTQEERAMRLVGDELVPGARYVMNHAITIDAPVDAVWPWLAQVGQDRAGFYSYDGLERAAGAAVHNADRIHPEWQQRAVGELVPAAPQGYLGGVFGDRPGWRVAVFEPGHAIVLQDWGAFVLRPLPDGRTRFHIRLRGDGAPSLASVVLAPLGLLGFEPAHFIMERGMMLGLRARAEGIPRS